jgi:hypothetical protein
LALSISATTSRASWSSLTACSMSGIDVVSGAADKSRIWKCSPLVLFSHVASESSGGDSQARIQPLERAWARYGEVSEGRRGNFR